MQSLSSYYCGGDRDSLLWTSGTSVWQRVAACCSVLQCVAMCCHVLCQFCSVLQRLAVCCSVLQRVAACCHVLPCVAVYCRTLPCIAVRCRVSDFLLRTLNILVSELVSFVLIGLITTDLTYVMSA